MNPVLHVSNLSHGPARQPRLQAIDFELGRGERLGLLGVNGAGKSTLMQLLAGVMAADSGRILVMGQALSEGSAARRHIGYLPQRLPLYGELSVAENLAWAAMLHGLHGAAAGTAADRVLEQMDLSNVRRRLASRLSTGMAQRLGLAQALIHAPSVLILDEPTAGLDPVQTEQIRALLANLDDDISLVLATHLLDDVRQLCDRVLLLDGGRKHGEHAVDQDADLLAHFRDLAAHGRGTTP